MKRVLVWGMTSNWGGIESILFNYATFSDCSKICFDFITTFEPIPRSEELKKTGSSIYYITSRRHNYWKYRKELKSFFKKHAKEYDAVWLNDCMFANIDILKFAKKYGIKKRIIHAHNSNNLGGGISRIIRHKINSIFLPLYATDYWACSQLAGEWSFSKKILNSNKYKVINNAIDCEKYVYDYKKREEIRQKLNISSEKFVIGHIGRFDYQKNHRFLLKILKQLYYENKDVILLSIGIGNDWELIKKEAKEMGLSKCILFLGQRNDIVNLYQAMDVFLLPSRFEGLPVVLVEAMASGLPCLVSDKITKEAEIIPELISFISIENGVIDWIQKINKINKNYDRKNTINEMRTVGYDIKIQTVRFYGLF